MNQTRLVFTPRITYTESHKEGSYNKQSLKQCKKGLVPFLSEGGLPSPGGKRPDTELGRKEYEIIFFLA